MTELKNYIKKEPLAKKMIKKPRVMKCFVKIYNLCCLDCKNRILKQCETFKIEMFCDSCKEKVKPVIEKLDRLMNK